MGEGRFGPRLELSRSSAEPSDEQWWNKVTGVTKAKRQFAPRLASRTLAPGGGQKRAGWQGVRCYSSP